MSKEKRKKKTDDDLQNNTQNTKDWTTRTPQQPGVGWVRSG